MKKLRFKFFGSLDINHYKINDLFKNYYIEEFSSEVTVGKLYNYSFFLHLTSNKTEDSTKELLTNLDYIRNNIKNHIYNMYIWDNNNLTDSRLLKYIKDINLKICVDHNLSKSFILNISCIDIQSNIETKIHVKKLFLKNPRIFARFYK